MALFVGPLGHVFGGRWSDLKFTQDTSEQGRWSIDMPPVTSYPIRGSNVNPRLRQLFVCPHCGKVFFMRREYLLHTMDKHSDKPDEPSLLLDQLSSFPKEYCRATSLQATAGEVVSMNLAKIGQEYLKSYQKGSIGNVLSRKVVEKHPSSIQLSNQIKAKVSQDELSRDSNLEKHCKGTKGTDIEGSNTLDTKVDKICYNLTFTLKSVH